MPEIKVNTNILAQWGAIIIALTFAWAVIDTQVKAQGTQVVDHEVRLRAIELGFARIEESLKPIGRMDDRLRSIEKAVKP